MHRQNTLCMSLSPSWYSDYFIGSTQGKHIFGTVGIIYGPAVDEATDRAKAAGVQDLVTFQQVDVSKLPGEYEVITAFDVIRDAVDPLGVLRALRRALASDGVYVCLDTNCSDKLEENIGPLGSMFHGFSVLYCMTTSLAWGGAGLGTLGFHERQGPRNVLRSWVSQRAEGSA